jgi:hypothetical protein
MLFQGRNSLSLSTIVYGRGLKKRIIAFIHYRHGQFRAKEIRKLLKILKIFLSRLKYFPVLLRRFQLKSQSCNVLRKFYILMNHRRGFTNYSKLKWTNFKKNSRKKLVNYKKISKRYSIGKRRIIVCENKTKI